VAYPAQGFLEFFLHCRITLAAMLKFLLELLFGFSQPLNFLGQQMTD
jgi:hypothetical protein